MDYRKMYDDKEHLYAFDLDGYPAGRDGRPERTLEIAGVSRGELTGEKNRKTKKPMVSFVGEVKKLALNKTNGRAVAALYGTDTDAWVGERITIFATTTEFGGETVDCIRVRPQRPERTDGAPPRNDARRNDRSAGNGKARSGQGGQSKAERDAAEVSAVTARCLIGEYEKIDGGPGSEERMAALKIERGRAWDTMNAADREAVGAAALAAKARIDAVAAGGALGNGNAGTAAAPDPSSAAADDADDDAASGAEP